MKRRLIGYLVIATPWVWLMDGVMTLENYPEGAPRYVIFFLGTVFVGVGAELLRS